jgi:hypothetical protein
LSAMTEQMWKKPILASCNVLYWLSWKHHEEQEDCSSSNDSWICTAFELSIFRLLTQTQYRCFLFRRDPVSFI